MENKLISVLSIIVLIYLSSCSVSSDPHTEKKLIGKWKAEIEFEEDLEGEGIKAKATLLCRYDRDNTFKAEMNCELLEPVKIHAMTIKMSGKWKASKEMLQEEIDKESLIFIPNEEFPSHVIDEVISEMKKELEKDDDPDQILNISTNSFTIYNEKEHQRIRFYRVVDEKYNEEYVDEVAEPIEDPYLNEHGNEMDVASNQVELPSWVPSDVLSIFGMENKLTMGSYESLVNSLLRYSSVDLLETNNFEGYINEYPVNVTMKIDRDGNVSGGYAYESTLKRYGDNPKSWFRFNGVILYDSDSNPYLFLQDRNPADDNIFEYALLEYKAGDIWTGNMINVKFLSDPSSHNLFNFRFGLK